MTDPADAEPRPSVAVIGAGIEAEGARVAPTPADARRDSGVAITMLPTAAVIRTVLLDNRVVDPEQQLRRRQAAPGCRQPGPGTRIRPFRAGPPGPS
jgi:hypothetical protein